MKREIFQRWRELEIKNIDKIPPTAPTINTSADETTEQPIKATIVPGVDNESGVDRTEYCLRGASTKRLGEIR